VKGLERQHVQACAAMPTSTLMRAHGHSKTVDLNSPLEKLRSTIVLRKAIE
jgi:hypothetical protein